MSEEIRPFEEYKEMIKDMRKEEMIRGLYDLSARVTKQENIIKEVREYVEKHIKYECDDAFNGKQFYSYHLYDFDKKELLEILDKEVN